ncbi:MAG: hypothetical protein NTW56_03435 [Alphaproteobacteria bacterium]|nr:hypothetical protein [Alphaproteobacteria bacterium]
MPRPAWIILAAALPFLALVALSWPAALDPGLYGDDLKWFGGPDNYQSNLEREARWLVYWWNTRIGLWPPWLTFTLCWVLWCACCALVADAMARGWRMLLLAAALAASPGAISILMWPMTTLPAMVVLAISVTSLRGWPGRAWPVLLGAAAMVLLHQLLAMMLVGFALLVTLGRGRAPWAALFGGAAGLALGMLAGLGLNWWLLGQVGLNDDPWRLAVLDGARGFTAAWRAAGIAGADMAQAMGPAFAPLALAALALGVAALWRRPLHLLMLAGIAGVTLAMPLATGMTLPELRGTMLLWLALVGLLGFALATRAARAAMVALAALVILALPPAGQRLARFSAEEDANRRTIGAILQATAEATREAPPRVLVMVGLPTRFQGLSAREEVFAWPLLQAEALTWRYFGRRLETDYCTSLCANGRVLRETPSAIFPAPGFVLMLGDTAVVRVGP